MVILRKRIPLFLRDSDGNIYGWNDFIRFASKQFHWGRMEMKVDGYRQNKTGHENKLLKLPMGTCVNSLFLWIK